jgi:hypothetical protein
MTQIQMHIANHLDSMPVGHTIEVSTEKVKSITRTGENEYDVDGRSLCFFEVYELVAE